MIRPAMNLADRILSFLKYPRIGDRFNWGRMLAAVFPRYKQLCSKLTWADKMG